ncbi:MAG TPA: hypothetical protein VMV43_09995 [Candidatus Nanopelagicaceae bacterium]|nr:hypothetical protein [Candidatus Nanopelagicaceae bacterium]
MGAVRIELTYTCSSGKSPTISVDSQNNEVTRNRTENKKLEAFYVYPLHHNPKTSLEEFESSLQSPKFCVLSWLHYKPNYA